jgi:hypothetical protein
VHTPPGRPVIVYFPHRGLEHNPRRLSRYPWNTDPHHARKFMCCRGRYVGSDGSLVETRLAFWGEWEAPSYVRRCWPEDGELPRFMHEPFWEYPKTNGFRQNTDPWIFGDCFRYSNCFQTRRTSKTDPRRRETALQRLAPGSLILFGSKADGGRFAIDTVFVVGSRKRRFMPVNPPIIDEAFRVCTVEALASADGAASGGGCSVVDAFFTLYYGATYEAPFEGMYSFVPCRRADHDNIRFARPPVALPGDPGKGWLQSPKIEPRSPPEVRQVWNNIRRLICEDRDCLIGVHFDTPPLDDTDVSHR